jgi:hypothetical protein
MAHANQHTKRKELEAAQAANRAALATKLRTPAKTTGYVPPAGIPINDEIPPLTLAASALTDQISDFEQLLASLEDRVSGFMTPRGPETDVCKAPTMSGAPHTVFVAQQSERLRISNLRLDSIIRAIEV